MENKNSKIEEALKSMLNIFNRDLPKGSIGEITCNKAIDAIEEIKAIQQIDTFIQMQEIIKNQTECLEQCYNLMISQGTERSPLGMQILLNIQKAKSL